MLQLSSFLSSFFKLGNRAMANSVESILVTQNTAGLQHMITSILPPLTYEAHKGKAGRIGVVGGCLEYTGAPYFAAISALKVGCDLSHVFCTNDAAIAIKSYSPELIVHPILNKDGAAKEIAEWLNRLHAIVIGPGLGRDPRILATVEDVLQKAKERNIPIVIDADGLVLVTEKPDLIKCYKKAILTPNIAEFYRLHKALTGNEPNIEDLVSGVTEVSHLLGNVTVVLKGAADIICDGLRVIICQNEGSPRRCGGQGDILSGSLGAFTFWSHSATENPERHKLLDEYSPTMCSAYAACFLTRECNRLAFLKNHRSTTTSDMIEQIPAAMFNKFIS